ncbi:MAG: helix-turn-helix domain-containing protein [Clostridia bacterium]|nr:helix-turn-helix domain-containing protein [Clostridia bacterium]
MTKTKQPITQKYFPMPNSIFRLGLESGEILVYAYLMYCEDRKTFQCHPSYSTIGEAVGMSKSTVRKHVDGLRRKGMITTEYTTVKTKDGRIHNGSLLYTLLPIEPIEEAYFQKMLRLQCARLAVKKGLEKYEKKERKKQ